MALRLMGWTWFPAASQLEADFLTLSRGFGLEVSFRGQLVTGFSSRASPAGLSSVNPEEVTRSNKSGAAVRGDHKAEGQRDCSVLDAGTMIGLAPRSLIESCQSTRDGPSRLKAPGGGGPVREARRRFSWE